MEEPGSRDPDVGRRDGRGRSATPAATRSASGGRSTPGRSTGTPDSGGRRSTTPEPPPVPPATYHWEEVRRQRTVGGYPWTHLNKPPFDENAWVKYERDHVYEPVTPATKTDGTKQSMAAVPPKDSGRFLRIPLTEELVMMADDDDNDDDDDGNRATTAGESEIKGRRQYGEEDGTDQEEEEEDEEEEEETDEDEETGAGEKPPGTDEESMIYEGENENSSAGETNDTRMKALQRKVRVKANVLRAKLQGVAKRKPKQKIAVDDGGSGGGDKKSRRRKFATLPRKFTFNAAKVNISSAFGNFGRNSAAATDADQGKAGGHGGRFSLPRFGLAKRSSASPEPARGPSTKTASGSAFLRPRTWSEASSRTADGVRNKLLEFGTYPRIFSKRRKTNKAETPPPPTPEQQQQQQQQQQQPPQQSPRPEEPVRRRFFRSHHKESTPGPPDSTAERMASPVPRLAVAEDELAADDGSRASKESLAGFGDSDLHDVIVGPGGVIEEIDSDEFFLREKGLSRGDVHISNYLSSEIRDVFRSTKNAGDNRTRSVERVHVAVDDGDDDNAVTASATAAIPPPMRPARRTNSLLRPSSASRSGHLTAAAAADDDADRFNTMPKWFGRRPAGAREENIVTSRTFEPSSAGAGPPSTFRVPWRRAGDENGDVGQQAWPKPPKPPARQRMAKFSTFDTRSMIDLSRKASSQSSHSAVLLSSTMNFSETAPRAPLRRSRTSLAGSRRDVSNDDAATANHRQPCWATGGGVPTPPLRRSRMSLTADADVDERAKTRVGGTAQPSTTPPPRPPPPTVAGYATVDKSAAASPLLAPPQSPARHRRKKSYDVIKSQEFGAFFTVPRSYRTVAGFGGNDDRTTTTTTTTTTTSPPPPPPSRPARAYNTLGPSRPRRRRLPVREHEYGDVSDDGSGATTDRDDKPCAGPRSSSLDTTDTDAAAVSAALSSGDVIEKMKFRPLPSPPPPPRFRSRTAAAAGDRGTPEPERRRNTTGGSVPFLDRPPREASATLSDRDFFADVSRALLASAAANAVVVVPDDDDVSVAVQTDPLPDGYELDAGESSLSSSSSCCSAAGSDRPLRADRPTSSLSAAAAAEYVDRPPSRGGPVSTGDAAVVPNCVYAPPDRGDGGGGGRCVAGVIRAHRIHVNELNVGTMTVAAGMPLPRRVSSAYPDSDEDHASSVLTAPTPPRRRSKPPASATAPTAAAAATDPSIAELSCQLFRLCHTNVCSLFNKVAHQVVPEDTEKRRDLQAALCFLSIILAGLLILGFGNEKTVHHHHWDFQFPPANQ